MSPRSILLLGAGPLQVPAVEAARRLGLRTVVMDANPAAPGMRLADRAVAADIRDAAAALELARAEEVRGVVSVCTDHAVRTVAAVAHALGLPGLSPEAAERATDKFRMREAFARFGAPAPRARRVASEDELSAAAGRLGFPVIVKPVDGVGSKGVTRVTRPDELDLAWKRAQAVSRTGVLVCEEYVEGPEVSVEGLTWEGETHLVAITDKLTSGPPYFVETGHTEVSRLPDGAQAQILEAARMGVEALGIDQAATHTEIKLGAQGPRIMEIGARLGGDRITSDLVPLATGVDIFAGAIRVALGEVPDVSRRFSRGAAIRYFLPEPGAVVAIEGAAESRAVEGVTDWVLDLKPGGRVPPLENSLSRVGHVVATGSTPDEAASRAEKSLARLRIATRP
ncbi:MAG: ATP-grasp domain-containing protein [Candidatus Eisenbacteria bacterium]|nr:ATP-grasp domain-containing protein [Candidatus Eisenbacteria bacterium]